MPETVTLDQAVESLLSPPEAEIETEEGLKKFREFIIANASEFYIK